MMTTASLATPQRSFVSPLLRPGPGPKPSRKKKMSTSSVSPAFITSARTATGYSQQYFDAGFNGFSTFPGNRAPLDAALAVRQTGGGPYQVLTSINAIWEISELGSNGLDVTETTGALPLQAFGEVLNVQNVTNYRFGDPTAFFDVSPTSTGGQRYVIVMHVISALRTLSEPGFMIIAVSRSADATGSWWVYRLTGEMPGSLACAAGQYVLPDYPQTSYDAHGVYITVPIFCGTTYQQTAVMALPKAQLYSGSLVQYAVWTGDDVIAAMPVSQRELFNPAPTFGFQPQPFRPQTAEDVGSVMYFVTQVMRGRGMLRTGLQRRDHNGHKVKLVMPVIS
jgi:hypothetical protein